MKPFDWTYSSDYKGTITGPALVTLTDERINLERLKEREKILFYLDLMLYEDELHDNGIASCTVKIVSSYYCTFFTYRYLIWFSDFSESNAQLVFHIASLLSPSGQCNG